MVNLPPFVLLYVLNNKKNQREQNFADYQALNVKKDVKTDYGNAGEQREEGVTGVNWNRQNFGISFQEVTFTQLKGKKFN